MAAIILIVDDEFAIREAVSLALVDEGFRVQTAWNGKQALELVERVAPHVIISDVMMPIVDGYTLVETLRRRNDLTPVILMSAGSHPLSGMPNVMALQKPFDLNHLLSLVRTLLRQ
jgi:DNA-binding response OmpR family regulator